MIIGKYPAEIIILFAPVAGLYWVVIRGLFFAKLEIKE